MSWTPGCGRNLNDWERRQFIRLIDDGAKPRTIKRKLDLSKQEVIHQMFFLPYHRRYLEVQDDIKAINRLRVNQPKEERDKNWKRKAALRKELQTLWNKLNEQWNEVDATLTRLRPEKGVWSHSKHTEHNQVHLCGGRQQKHENIDAPVRDDKERC